MAPAVLIVGRKGEKKGTCGEVNPSRQNEGREGYRPVQFDEEGKKRRRELGKGDSPLKPAARKERENTISYFLRKKRKGRGDSTNPRVLLSFRGKREKKGDPSFERSFKEGRGKKIKRKTPSGLKMQKRDRRRQNVVEGKEKKRKGQGT